MPAYNAIFGSKSDSKITAIDNAVSDMNYRASTEVSVLDKDVLGDEPPWSVEFLVMLEGGDDPETVFLTAETWDEASVIPVGKDSM
jgi:hypothetical protein